MKKGFMIFGGVLGAVLCLSSCTASLDDIKNDLALEGGYGSVKVCNDNERKLDMTLIGFANASVSGKGIEEGSEPKAVNISVDNGTGSFTIEKIPAGKNRIITVQALDTSKTEIYNVTMRAVCDVEVGKETEISVNWSTTPYANVLYYINKKGSDVSVITDTDKQRILSLIDPTVSPLLIDYEKLATDFINKTLQESSSSYVLSPASISVDLGAEASGNFKIQVCDPSSEVYQGNGSTGTFSGIAPGTWQVYLFNAAGEKVQTKTAIFKSGRTTEVSFVPVTDEIIVHLETSSPYKNIYAWTDAPKVEPFGKWPGKAMEDTNGDGWYDTIIEYTSINLIFNGSGQTGNLSRSAGEWWYKDGKWYDEDPTDSEKPVIESFVANKTENVSGIVTFTLTASDNKALKKAEITINGVKKTLEFSSVSDTVTLEYDTSVLKNGTYTVSAVVFDMALNESSQETLSITTNNVNRPPVAVIKGATLVAPGKTLTFKGSSSYDPNGTVTNYKWTYTGSGSLKVDSEDPSICTVDFTGASVGNTGTLTLTVTDDDGETNQASKTISVQELKPIDFREETIYFAMTTRFYDGDKSNNVHCWDENPNTPADDPAWRGDFKGLIEKLDYIKALGFSAIWITPVVENASGLDYHGYHAMNFTKVDPRYESSDVKFQDLIDAVHSKGMKLVLDVVFNHTGNFGEANLAPMFEKDYSADLSDINASMKLSADSLLDESYFALPAALQYQTRLAKMKNTDGVNHDTRNFYHHYANYSWDDFTCQWGQIAGDCVDLNTENPAVLEYIVNAYSQYIAMGVDAFRVDTVKHIPRLSFNKYLNEAFMDAAAASGNDNFYMFGEVCARANEVVYRGTPNMSAYFYTWKEDQEYEWSNDTTLWDDKVIFETDYPQMPFTAGEITFDVVNAKSAHKQGLEYAQGSTKWTQRSDNHLLRGNEYHDPDHSMKSGLDVIDFPMHWNFDSASGAFSVHGEDWRYNDATYNVVYVDSHDYAPCGDDTHRFHRGTDVWAENLDLMFTFRGIPCLYYGSEIEFMKGAIIDKGPLEALCDTGRAYFGDYLEGEVNASDFSKYTASGTVAETLSYPLAKHIQRLNMIRREIPALQKGQYSTENCTGNNLAFKRRYTKDGVDSFVLVTISGDATFSDLPAGTYVDAVTGDSKTVSEGGSLTTSGCSGQANMRVYVLNGEGKIGENTEWLK